MNDDDKAIAQDFCRTGMEATALFDYPVAFWLEAATSTVRAQGDVIRGNDPHAMTASRTIEEIKDNPERALGYCIGFLDAVRLANSRA